MLSRKRLIRFLLWGFLLVSCVLAGGLAFAYLYVTDSQTLKELVLREAPRFFPGSRVTVGQAQVRPLLGEVTLGHIRLQQTLDGKPFETVQVAWLNIRHDIRAFLEGRVSPRQVLIAQPLLRLSRRSDGTWNLMGLLADPWPLPVVQTPPVVIINGGTIQVDLGERETSEMILRDVSMRAEPTGQPGQLRFEGTARGGPFERLKLAGTLDLKTHQVVLSNTELSGLALSGAFCRCLPEWLGAQFHSLGLSGGEVDVSLRQLTLNPDRLGDAQYDASLILRGGTLAHAGLPDTLAIVEGKARLTPRELSLERLSARSGKMAVRVRGTLDPRDPQNGPADLQVDIFDLELDERLRRVLPAQMAQWWNEYLPSGRLDLAARLVRRSAGAPPQFAASMACRDVGMTFYGFPYPLQHIQGTLVWEGQTIRIDVGTLVGGGWATAQGTIENPGPNAVLRIDFASPSFPIDDTLKSAMPAPIREVINAFEPTGSLRGVVHLVREPPPRDNSGQTIGEENLDIHGELDLNNGCSVRWSGMPYLVRDLTGHLDFTKERWVFSNMKGTNSTAQGAAQLRADGEVIPLGPDKQKVRLALQAEHLPLDQQLRDALPPQWQATWETLNPSGLCGVDARITSEPEKGENYHITIIPEAPETRVRLALQPHPNAPAKLASKPIELPPMENVTGTFVFDNGMVQMREVNFQFREAPVTFKEGSVSLKDNGQFDLKVRDLLVTKLRLDAELRKNMPPVMAAFSRRLDDGRSFWLHGNLGISWSGQTGEPAQCRWDQATVVLNGNSIESGLPLRAIQGQLESVSGWSDGHSIRLSGALNLESVHVLNQQITQIRSNLVVQDDWARLDAIQAHILGGAIEGRVAMSLDSSPEYRAALKLSDADLSRYTQTLPGRQSMKGLVSGAVEIAGQGSDLRSMTGSGWAQVREGDLGELPLFLRWVKVPSFRPPTRTAFDSAEVVLAIRNGLAILDPVKFTGDAFSLMGAGTLELQGLYEVDLRLSPVYGRDDRSLSMVSQRMRDMVREAGGRVFDLHVTGPISSPTITPQPLPDVWTRTNQAFRDFSTRRTEKSESTDSAILPR